ncbi:methyltransferase domain-containing protein [Candidatus Saccharibacteria bacterium]|nr:methyltransferase domain-containing protein [Candidatus Saccharibacteria bacterium]MCL1962717.1 methyltransferase domain-containing protein [Candidatus Saccharibacteria bacterium]
MTSTDKLLVKEYQVDYIDQFMTVDGKKRIDDYVELTTDLANKYRESQGITTPLHEIPRPMKIDKNNWGVEYLMNKAPTFEEWLDTSALATTVETLYDPINTRLKSGQKLDPFFSEFLQNLEDAIGIRARSYILTMLMAENVREKENWLSLACGNALPVLRAAEAAKNKPMITLVDFNFDNLRYARKIAKARGQNNLISEHMFRDLTHKKGFQKPQHGRTILASLLFRKRPVISFSGIKTNFYDRIESCGFVEYLPPKAAALYLKRVFDLLAPGGVFIFDSYNVEHPQRDFTEGVIQWPLVKFRNQQETIDIIEESGVPIMDNTVDVYPAPNKVCTVYKIRKPLN